MWKGVETRKHVVNQVYTLDQEANQIMLNGTVRFLPSSPPFPSYKADDFDFMIG